MAKKFIQKYMPDPNKIKQNKTLKIFGPLLHMPDLWAINKKSVTRAFTVGLFMAYVPVPFQMALAAGASIIVRSNMPISVALVWISNPVTMPFLYPIAYLLGAYILGTLPSEISFSSIYHLITTDPGAILGPFLFGCLIHGVVLGIICNLLIRAFWKDDDDEKDIEKNR